MSQERFLTVPSTGEVARPFEVLLDEASAARLGTVRHAVASVASSLGLAPEVVLAPQVQRYLAWAPLDPSRPSGDEVEERMVNRGARDWQIDLTLDPICDALGV